MPKTDAISARSAPIAAKLWTGPRFDGKLKPLREWKDCNFEAGLMLLRLIEHGDDHDRRCA
jgi:hypothetical protein